MHSRLFATGIAAAVLLFLLEFLPQESTAVLSPKAPILMLQRTRSYQDGPLAGSYMMNTKELITLQVPKNWGKNGVKWAVYGGEGKICRIQQITARAIKALFTCDEEGTYVAFAQPQLKLADPILIDPDEFRSSQEISNPHAVAFASISESLSTEDYEKEILSGYFHSDPFTIVNNAYCYRWGYRLDEVNEVGILHTDANPLKGSAGTFRVIELKVWILESGASVLNEIYWDKPTITQTDYSKLITNRFRSLGIEPCIREAHHAMEVTGDPEWGETLGLDQNSEQILTRHWTFRIKLYLDRMISQLTDVTFTIKSRQLSGLYGCFVADVRVFLKAKQITFLQHQKFKKDKVHLNNSNFPPAMRHVIVDHATHLLGNRVKYDGPPWFLGEDVSEKRRYSIVVPNPCVSLEMVITYQDKVYVTNDFLLTQELFPIILPGITADEMLLEVDANAPNETWASNNETKRRSEEDPYHVTDFAFTPTHLVVLRSDSILLLHPSDLDFKGIGVNYGTQKFRIGGLVRRKWCPFSATPKIQNQLVPGFSRSGNFIVVYIVPLEKKLAINEIKPSAECTIPRDTTKGGQREVQTHALTEEQIHKYDDKIEIEASIEHRSQAQRRRKAEELEEARKALPPLDKDAPDFWFFEDSQIPPMDSHFVQGESHPSNVRINFTGIGYNRNVVFVVDKDFIAFRKSLEELAGLQFDAAEKLTGGAQSITRLVNNDKIMAMHAVEFSAVEKRYLAVVEFQSQEFPRAKTRPDDNNDITCVIAQYEAVDLASESAEEDPELEEAYLEDIRIPFTGCILYRKNFEDDIPGANNSYQFKDEDFQEDINGVKTDKLPVPLQKRTATLRTINSAFPYYIVKLADVIVFGTTDCAFARPLTYFDEANPSPEQFNIRPVTTLRRSDYDLVVTREGILSVLYHPRISGITQDMLIGSLLSNEPLRIVSVFSSDNTHFQVQTPEGEIVYGKLKIKKGFIESPPSSRIYEIPFWSLLRGNQVIHHGSILYSLGYNKFQLANQTVNASKLTMEPTISRNDICAYSSFSVQYFKRNYAEAGYRIRITAEVAYHGDSIPLDADLLVEFNEIQGLSVEIDSLLEVDNDLTLIKKTIEIKTFLTEPTQRTIFEKHLEHVDGQAYTDFVRVFTATIRPSVLNLHCERTNYFQTVHLNVGCVPNSKMRLLAENLPLKKQPIKELTAAVKKDELEVDWFWNKTGDYITLPRDRVNFRQRALFQCEKDNVPFCKIPHANLINGNFYSLSYRDNLVPAFEHFLTSHVRRVTGNIIIYDILESWKDEATRLTVNTTQWDARCLIDDQGWYGSLATKAAGGIDFHDHTKLYPHADIYNHFDNCFSRTPSPRRKSQEELPTLRARDLSKKRYWVFNHTNFNALQLNKTRNYIYILRAVVLNTDYNSFTYCQVMDTYFALRVANVAPQREPLTWYIYVTIILAVALLVFASYVYFYRTYSWRTDLERDKPRLIEEHRARLLQEALSERGHHAFKDAAERARIIAHWKSLRQKKDADQKEPSAAGPSSKPSATMSKSGAAAKK